METPRFPLDEAPACRRCRKPCTLYDVNERNQNGHIGRPYYTCLAHPKSIFSTFNDYQGITDGNPRCWCGFLSRKSVNNAERKEFYCCPVGRCGFSRSAGTVAQTNGNAFVDGLPKYPGPRLDIEMEAQGVGARAAHRGRCCGGCVVM